LAQLAHRRTGQAFSDRLRPLTSQQLPINDLGRVPWMLSDQRAAVQGGARKPICVVQPGWLFEPIGAASVVLVAASPE
ncbi:hypothetical protein, partial [Murinocardiopsis flavida]|uniref:hypothetical protein n=1 Tax=Murinocardiopsis flavida TaxID=645275 RepID=UPI001B80154C